jgi:hypothetical protein
VKRSLPFIGSSILVFISPSAWSAPFPASALQRHKIEEISSIFESGTPVFAYGDINDIGDGAGVGAGRLGFNCAAGDLLEVVQKYSDAYGGKSSMSQYISCLQAYAQTNSYACLFPSVDQATLNSQAFKDGGMVQYDFAKAWVQAASDPVMQKIQDELVQINVYDVDDDWAAKLGIKTVFAYEVLFDTILQQGAGPETNSLVGMLRRAGKSLATAHPEKPEAFDPAHGANEIEWLQVFLLQRKETLHYGFNDNDVENAVVAPYECYERADSLLQVWAAENWDLSAPIQFNYFGDVVDLTD